MTSIAHAHAALLMLHCCIAHAAEGRGQTQGGAEVGQKSRGGPQQGWTSAAASPTCQPGTPSAGYLVAKNCFKARLSHLRASLCFLAALLQKLACLTVLFGSAPPKALKCFASARCCWQCPALAHLSSWSEPALSHPCRPCSQLLVGVGYDDDQHVSIFHVWEWQKSLQPVSTWEVP